MATVKVTKVVKINIPKILNKVENDNFGTFLAQRWKALISPYTPRREGLLEDTAIIRPFEIEYIQPYSHYMYNGVVYEDPLLHVSGIYDASKDAWFSRKNVQKVPRQTASEGRSITFNYLRDSNPRATHHWDTAAENAGLLTVLGDEATAYLDKNII